MLNATVLAELTGSQSDFCGHLRGLFSRVRPPVQQQSFRQSFWHPRWRYLRCFKRLAVSQVRRINWEITKSDYHAVLIAGTLDGPTINWPRRSEIWAAGARHKYLPSTTTLFVTKEDKNLVVHLALSLVSKAWERTVTTSRQSALGFKKLKWARVRA